MGVTALILGILLYIVVAYDFYSKENYPLMIVFICYALANIGFIMAAPKSGKDL